MAIIALTWLDPVCPSCFSRQAPPMQQREEATDDYALRMQEEQIVTCANDRCRQKLRAVFMRKVVPCR